jgi:hypothetical protein
VVPAETVLSVKEVAGALTTFGNWLKPPVAVARQIE